MSFWGPENGLRFGIQFVAPESIFAHTLAPFAHTLCQQINFISEPKMIQKQRPTFTPLNETPSLVGACVLLLLSQWHSMVSSVFEARHSWEMNHENKRCCFSMLRGCLRHNHIECIDVFYSMSPHGNVQIAQVAFRSYLATINRHAKSTGGTAIILNNIKQNIRLSKWLIYACRSP